MNLQFNPYDVLRTASTASPEEIKRAYWQLSRQYHPDTNPEDPGAEERFKEINYAYEILSDPEKRRKYDDERKPAPSPAGPRRMPDKYAGMTADELWAEAARMRQQAHDDRRRSIRRNNIACVVLAILCVIMFVFIGIMVTRVADQSALLSDWSSYEY